MATIRGTERNDSWTVVNPGTFVIDGLGGVDTLDLGTSLRSEYTITQGSNGEIYVDSVSGASAQFHATLFNFEKLTFASKRDSVDLATYFADTAAPTLISFSAANNLPVQQDIVLNFSENIIAATGTVRIKTADGKIVEEFDIATSKNLTLNGKNLLINPSQNLSYGQDYSVELSSGAVKDAAANLYVNQQSYTFKTVVGEIITGTSANDILISSAGSDTINGSAGNDIVVFAGKLSTYKLNHIANNYFVAPKTGNVGSDSLTSVESLKFDDLTVNLKIQDFAATAPAENVQRLIELYVAFFNRVPEADGLAYWIGEMKSGMQIDLISEVFYEAGVEYSELTGFTASMSNTEFIIKVYQNVLGRVDGPDAEGLAYWNTQLTEGTASRGKLVSTILDAAHGSKGNPEWGWVSDLLDNKIAVAKMFAVNWGLGYATPETAIQQGMAIAAAVTPTDIQAAISLIGISSADMQLT
ncbi:DUF4214 domain-containing protein [Undibacterium seohonense]|uniref:DUF4214 domain-containing protein n=1 Tax=Undibacterium seohonense TaxID=1344950 RepID=A0ABR6X5J4_9BURK|nr:DUF4214 domain-containing protein [Undibacterium seohonense]MBC3807865.1 DUF4214 domain-containing protein [Undibacterium seohonense]